MIHVKNNPQYYINDRSLSFSENDLGDPNRVAVSLVSGTVIMVHEKGVIDYASNGSYEKWTLRGYSTKLARNDKHFIYARLSRADKTALLVFSTNNYNTDGSITTVTGTDKNGNETTSTTEPNENYFYVKIGELTGTDGSSLRVLTYDSGLLGTDKVKDESDGFSDMWELDKHSTPWLIRAKQWLSAFTVKGFIRMVGGFTLSKGGERDDKIISDIKRSVDNDDEVPVSDENIATSKYVDNRLEDLDNRFLRKDQDDTAKGVLTFEKQIKSSDFMQGELMGSGWSVYRDQNGNAVVETDRIVVRKDLSANELVVNQETFSRGSTIFVKGGCAITEVEEHDGFYRCYYDNQGKNRFSGFKEGDQARCQRYDKSFGSFIKYYWRLVVSVGDNYVDLSKQDADGSGLPEEGDDIAQLGNRSDRTRQSAVVISPDSGGSVVVWAGIDSYSLSEKNMVGMGVNPSTGRAYLYGYGDMFFGDRNLKGNFITFQQKEGDEEPKMHINADIDLGAGSTGLGNLSEFREIASDVSEVKASMNSLAVDMESIREQADREFTIWYFDAEPTLENEPAVNWDTQELIDLHDQDLYFSDLLARAWRFVDGQWVEITDERTLAALRIAQEAHDFAEEAKAKANEVKSYIDGVLPSELEALQKQIDGAIESYFHKYDPTSGNEPASSWQTPEQKKAHLNDTFTNLSTGRSWRWAVDGETYGWVEITDTATVEALRLAGLAQDTADSKRRVFVDTPYTPYDIGDLWVQGETGDILRCSVSKDTGSFTSSDWVKASKYTDDSALEKFISGDFKMQIENIQSQMDRRAETWYQSTDPSLYWNTDELKQLHIGDLWYDTNRDQSFMWNGTQWVTQGVPDEVFDKIDGKSSIYTSRPSSYAKNDLWILGSETSLDKLYPAGTVVVAMYTSSSFVSSHWTKADRYTDDTVANGVKDRLDSWASDGSISPLEKTALRQQMYDIKGEYQEMTVSAAKYGLSVGSFTEAYTKAVAALLKYTAEEPENIEVGTDYGHIEDYYEARSALRQSIDAKIKEVSDKAYTKAVEADGKAQTLSDELKDVQVDMESVKEQADREYTIWYFDAEPTLENEPAVNWDTQELIDLHDQDLYFSDLLARAWRFVDGQWVEITDERTLAALRIAQEAHDFAEEAKAKANEVKSYIDGVLPSELEALQKQIDGAIESYFHKYDPTSGNEPASSWQTPEQKKAHLNDTFTNLSTGRSWRWAVDGETYGWVEITDTATVEALRLAGLAQDTADSKRRVFVDTPYTPYDIGDLWVQGETGDILRCSVSKDTGSFTSSDWVKASKYTDDSALEKFISGDFKMQIENIQSQMDRRAETWYQSTDPSLYWNTDELKQLHIGDLWYDTNRDQSFMWNGTQWVTQGVPDEVFDKIDGKSSIYTSRPSSYAKNDLWILGSETSLDKLYPAGTVVVAMYTSSSFVSSHWTKADRYTDDTVANGVKDRLDSWASDGSISPLEKTALRQQMYDIKGEYQEMTVSAAKYGLSVGSFTEAYTKAVAALLKYTAEEPENIEVGTDYGHIEDYYEARSALRQSIDAKIKEVSDKAYTKAVEADGKAQTLSDELKDVQVDMESVKEQADREYTIWYFDAEPTLENEPAVNWTTPELVELHDQDLYFSDALARAWRFVNGAWIEITDERTLAALRIAQEALDKTSDFEYLKKVFGKNVNIVRNGVYMADLVSVINDEEDVEAFINGSDFAADPTDGKLLLACGIPESSSDGSAELEDRAREASIRFYESGAGQYAHGNIRWTKEGVIFRRTADVIEWVSVGGLLDEGKISDGGTLDLRDGCYIDTGVGGVDGVEVWLPQDIGYDVPVHLIARENSRSTYYARLRGRFKVKGSSTVYDKFSVEMLDEPFELSYDSFTDCWRYRGNYFINDDGVVCASTNYSSSEVPSTGGYSGSFTISESNRQHSFVFTDGLLISYSSKYTGGGN